MKPKAGGKCPRRVRAVVLGNEDFAASLAKMALMREAPHLSQRMRETGAIFGPGEKERAVAQRMTELGMIKSEFPMNAIITTRKMTITLGKKETLVEVEYDSSEPDNPLWGGIPKSKVFPSHEAVTSIITREVATLLYLSWPPRRQSGPPQ